MQNDMNAKTKKSVSEFENLVVSQFRDPPAAPNSTPPTVESLRRLSSHRRAQQQRVRQRSMRACGTVVAIAMFAITMVALRNNERIVQDDETPALLTTSESRIALQTPTEEFEPSFRVLAHVMQPEPIFHVDPETQQAWQVGWIETEHTIPVDMTHFSPAQQARIQNVLFQNNDSPSL